MNQNFIDLRNINDDFHYMIIDSRYVLNEDFGKNAEARLAITYGPNLTREMGGMLSPPRQKGEFVYGLHNVIVTDSNKVHIVDSWLTSYPTKGENDLGGIIKRAQGLLGAMGPKECAKLLEADEKKYTKDDVKERPIDNPQYCFGEP
jgi:hypothetical protein